MEFVRYILYTDPDYKPDNKTIVLFNKVVDRNHLISYIVPTSGWSSTQLSIENKKENSSEFKYVHGNKDIQDFLNSNCSLEKVLKQNPVINSDTYY